MTLIVCGPAKGETHTFRCPCCGMESNDVEAFAVSLCWACGFGGNLDCANCVEAGVWVDRFPSKRGRGHRFKAWDDGTAVAWCGQRIPRGDIGQATAVRKSCRHCWPEPEGLTA